jgi:hypothetical protein
VETGIQEAEEENWIPAGVYPGRSRGRNDGHGTTMVKVDFKSTCYFKPFAYNAKVV